MDLNRATQKVQEAVQAAQAIAVRHSHQEIDVEHLLAALLEQPDGLAPRLFEQMGVAVAGLQAGEVERSAMLANKLTFAIVNKSFL